MEMTWRPSRPPTDYEAQVWDDSWREFNAMITERNLFAVQWEEVSELILPAWRNTFFYGSYNVQGMKKTDRQVDATGMVALNRFAAICDSLLTPRNMKWHTLTTDNDYVMKDRQTQLWFEDTTKRLFKYRYSPESNFASQNYQSFQQLGAFGNSGMFIDEFDDPNGRIRGLRYRCIPLGELYFHEDHQGIVDGFVRHFRLTARQAFQKWAGKLPECMRTALEQKSEMKFNFLHRVCPRQDYEDGKLPEKGKPYASFYLCIEGKCLLEEGGYRTFPLGPSRYQQTPMETYGRGPAMNVLPALKTLNLEKRIFLKQGHRAADPVLMTNDDGVVGMSLRPGSMNKGGVTSDGKPLVHVLPTGEIQISKEMMAEEKQLINDEFLVNLFQILTESPQMTATEVIERTNEKGILLAPTVGRQQSEYLGPIIHRELDVLAAQGLLLPMPPALREAKGEYQVVYTSPLSRAMRAQEAAGFWRTVDQVKDVFAIAQDPSLLDPFDFDVAVPATAEINGTLPSWMADDKSIEKKRKNRADAQAAEQKIRAAPAQAALNSSQAKMAAAGMQQPGQQQPAAGPPQP